MEIASEAPTTSFASPLATHSSKPSGIELKLQRYHLHRIADSPLLWHLLPFLPQGLPPTFPVRCNMQDLASTEFGYLTLSPTFSMLRKGLSTRSFLTAYPSAGPGASVRVVLKGWYRSLPISGSGQA